eukprot:gb/GECG01016826.1/.p1 GENE.gb/GECG01016826.1/~~gb/GECG01016826.1/.p1  ORF type:complete len:484 (+),score=47.23 gb/GECG01016826.1/:1-1452(+)
MAEQQPLHLVSDDGTSSKEEMHRVPLLSKSMENDDSSPINASEKDSDNGYRQTPLITPKLILLVVGLIAARSADQAIYYRIAYEMDKFSWFLSAFVLPFGFLAVVFPIAWYKLLFTSSVPKETRRWGVHKLFCVFGILDTLFNVVSTLPVEPIGGTAANVLSQSVIPFQMVCNYLFLGNSFRKSHYLGVTLAVYGVLVKLIPQFQGNSDSSNGASSSGIAYIGWSLVMIASAIPSAMSNAFKEVVLKKVPNLDEFYMAANVGLWQLIFGMVTIPTIGIPFTANYVPLNQLGDYIKDASNCFVGNQPHQKSECGNGAGGVAPVWLFLIFVGFNITFNLLMLMIFRQGSSVLFVVASTVRLPLVDILLMWRLLSGPAYAKFSLFDGFALFALIVGIAAYQSDPEIPGNGPRLKSFFYRLCQRLSISCPCWSFKARWCGTPRSDADHLQEAEGFIQRAPETYSLVKEARDTSPYTAVQDDPLEGPV